MSAKIDNPVLTDFVNVELRMFWYNTIYNLIEGKFDQIFDKQYDLMHPPTLCADVRNSACGSLTAACDTYLNVNLPAELEKSYIKIFHELLEDFTEKKCKKFDIPYHYKENKDKGKKDR